MNGVTILLGSAVIFLIAYLTYGSWLAKQWGVDPSRKTPAETEKDGIDYLPTRPAVLLGHHFSSIAGAGPIVGPITAAVFGWVPVTLWIIVGSIFFGGVHDYGSLVASLRHKGQSIGQIIDSNIGERAKLLFAIFAWVTLLVIIAAFANIVAATFVANPGAGSSSLLFIVLAVAFGLLVYRSGMSLAVGTVIGLIGMAAAFWLGHIFPITLSKDVWLLLMMGYIFVASIAPVWILLQPRDYLNSFLLYIMIAAAFIGICLYQPEMEISPFVGFDLGGGQWLFPVLFVTVACGAISGFHSLVSSGTSSKQLDNERNAKLIGYGSMLIEGLLAICAIISVAYVSADKLPELLKNGGPVNAFSQGTATFMTAIGLDFNLSKEFVALTISAFALTTLDTATRLGRFIFQEMVTTKAGANSPLGKAVSNRYVATGITIALAWIMSTGSYLTIWPIFGTANQMLAALALLAIAAWLKKSKRNHLMITIPMYFMFAVTFCSLGQLIYANLGKNWLIVGVSTVLAVLSAALAVEAFRVFGEENRINASAQAQNQQ
ncbi:carbon starvation protein A [Parasutterella muris]|jgi:Carbon starvation protein, predicted membrane protein|uniref:Carbon starvation protein A n=1 Tax=Parasutterella muris TaxID=2565572 RepID=A0A6L6YPC3_9BURK|nr:carbon starvation protein A [Parasutterella muris]MVX57371.1 carbon starvation protein A [Parasutterella muris]